MKTCWHQGEWPCYVARVLFPRVLELQNSWSLGFICKWCFLPKWYVFIFLLVTCAEAMNNGDFNRTKYLVNMSVICVNGGFLDYSSFFLLPFLLSLLYFSLLPSIVEISSSITSYFDHLFLIFTQQPSLSHN